MNPSRRAKIGLILLTFSVCGAAAITQRWRDSRHAVLHPTELYAVVLAQMDAFRRADFPRAYRHVSNSVQEQFNVESYADFVRHDHLELRHAERIEFGAIRAEGRRALVPTYFFMANGDVIPCAYSLIHEEDGWKIDGVRVHPRWPATQRLQGVRL
jgi:Domain of unknown function (DUF4864)